MAPSKLNEWFPHAQNPIIISAPMLGTSNGTLAAEVSKAGGIGMIPGPFNFTPTSPQLPALTTQLTTARSLLSLPPSSPLPLGVGFILSHPSTPSHFLPTILPLLRPHRPRAVWLFAPRPEDVADGTIKKIITALRAEEYVVFYQVGTVASARQAVRDGADVLVVQGADAGGHGFVGGAGVVSLVPEVGEMVNQEGREGEVVVVAAGGVVDGRGVAAALALGAEGVVMGTRFIAAEEAWTPEFSKKLVLETADGGPSTVRTPVFDDIQSTAIWPGIYDGRAITGKSWEDHAAGMPVEENIRLFNEADKAGDMSRKITWVGTGVGLVKDVRPAGDIVREVREDAIQRIRKLQARI